MINSPENTILPIGTLVRNGFDLYLFRIVDIDFEKEQYILIPNDIDEVKPRPERYDFDKIYEDTTKFDRKI